MVWDETASDPVAGFDLLPKLVFPAPAFTDQEASDQEATLKAGQLAVAGREINWNFVWEGFRTVTPAPAKESRMTVMINGTNYGKAYSEIAEQVSISRKQMEEAPAASVRKPQIEEQETEEQAIRPTNERVSPAVPLTVSAASSNAPNGSWLNAWAELQLYSAEAHQQAQRAMLESHLAHLESASWRSST